VAPSHPSRRAVCVVSVHPLFFPIIRGLLPEDGYELEDYRLPPDSLPPQEIVVPKASVYIIESQPRLTATEVAIEKVTFSFPSAALLVVGESFDDANTFPLLRLKVRAVVTYAEAEGQLVRAIAAISGGGFWMPRALLSRFVEAAVSSGRPNALPRVAANLTHREQQVVDGLLENLSNKEIAHRLGITERGVKFHVSNLLAKHRVRRRADLILLFLTSR